MVDNGFIPLSVYGASLVDELIEGFRLMLNSSGDKKSPW